MVGVERMERAERIAADVERAVVIEQPGAAAFGKFSAKTKVLAEPFMLP
jgi:hypothetical protein